MRFQKEKAERFKILIFGIAEFLVLTTIAIVLITIGSIIINSK